MTAFQRLRSNERGMSMVFVSLSLAAFISATALAIDVGMFMNSRTQAQSAADAGALAGATALALNDFDDRSATGPAVVGAINTAVANHVAGGEVSVKPSDVDFPLDTVTGEHNLVQVTVYRTKSRKNEIPTLIGQLLKVNSVDIQATATAQAMPANNANCVMPLTIPDKWIDKSCGAATCTWSQTETFDQYDKSGAPLPNPDVYIPPGEPGATGYSPVTDRGVQLVLKTNNGDKAAPSLYNPWDQPGSVGGDDYRHNIATCNPNYIDMGFTMTPENGNMVGPTKDGMDDLIASDPDAKYDPDCKCVLSKYSVSPRIRIVPLYDPVYFSEGKKSGKSSPQLRVVNYLGFFIESITGGGEVTGRIVPVTAKFTKDKPIATGGFARAIMLVK